MPSWRAGRSTSTPRARASPTRRRSSTSTTTAPTRSSSPAATPSACAATAASCPAGRPPSISTWATARTTRSPAPRPPTSTATATSRSCGRERDWYAGSAHMWCFNGRNANGSNMPGFPQEAPDEFSNALDVPFVLGDVDGDGDLEAWGPALAGQHLRPLPHLGLRSPRHAALHPRPGPQREHAVALLRRSRRRRHPRDVRGHVARLHRVPARVRRRRQRPRRLLRACCYTLAGGVPALRPAGRGGPGRRRRPGDPHRDLERRLRAGEGLPPRRQRLRGLPDRRRQRPPALLPRPRRPHRRRGAGAHRHGQGPELATTGSSPSTLPPARAWRAGPMPCRTGPRASRPLPTSTTTATRRSASRPTAATCGRSPAPASSSPAIRSR